VPHPSTMIAQNESLSGPGTLSLYKVRPSTTIHESSKSTGGVWNVGGPLIIRGWTLLSVPIQSSYRTNSAGPTVCSLSALIRFAWLQSLHTNQRGISGEAVSGDSGESGRTLEHSHPMTLSHLHHESDRGCHAPGSLC
jgi:hypothetical protein